MEPSNEKQHYERGIRGARLTAIILGVAVLIVGIIGAQNADQGIQPESEPRSQRVEYQVTGTSKLVRIQYLNDMAFDATREGEPPWRFGFRARQGRQLEVLVQNLGDGTIGCGITASGEDLSREPEQNVAILRCVAVVP
ncbi:MAG: hypothetical protein FJ040_09020 [Chloroflexi bacterium]|nr:hypothetical protein [Chloroflexota bacterium]